MSVITVPVSDEQKAFVEEMIKSGRAANKAHVMRVALDFLRREEAMASLRRAREDIKKGRVFKGNLDELAPLFD
jgi:Arc/MetJ-type ribon-helix-helix transcriptional regulator